MIKNLKILTVLLVASLTLAGCFGKKNVNNVPVAGTSAEPDKVLYERALEDIRKGRHSVGRLTLQTLINQLHPDFAFFLSGVDILATDKFGKLKVTLPGCRRRDEIVFTQLHRHGIPCTVAMGGGYSPDVKTIVDAHCNTFRTALEVYF